MRVCSRIISFVVHWRAPIYPASLVLVQLAAEIIVLAKCRVFQLKPTKRTVS